MFLLPYTDFGRVEYGRPLNVRSEPWRAAGRSLPVICVVCDPARIQYQCAAAAKPGTHPQV